jgi:hypothetical protein
VRELILHTLLLLNVCQVELKDKNGLFYMAHKLVDSYPEKPIAWFAVGCYYHLVVSVWVMYHWCVFLAVEVMAGS